MSGVCPFSAKALAGKSSASSAAAPESIEKGVDDCRPPLSCPAGFGSAASSATKATCPLGFGSSQTNKQSLSSVASLPRIPLAVLARHAQSDKARLVAMKGVVFDVSTDLAFEGGTAVGGGQFGRLIGHDASRFIAVTACRDAQCADENIDLVVDAGLEGLTYEEHQRLESYFVEMMESRRAVAVLAEEDYVSIFGMPFGGGERSNTNTNTNGNSGSVPPFQSSSSSTVANDQQLQLHSFVEQGDVESARRVIFQHFKQQQAEHEEQTTTAAATATTKTLPPAAFSSGNAVDMEKVAKHNRTKNVAVTIVDAPCNRTGMTPLLKAVEGGSEGLVRVLLEAGADVRSQAALYDGDDAISLARRLGSREEIVEILLPYYTV